MGSNATTDPAIAAPRRPLTQPPPPPVKKQSHTGPLPISPVAQVPTASNRSTGMWAADAIPAAAATEQSDAGPLGGRLRTASAEPGFAGRVRVMPTDESSFRTGKTDVADDDDDDLLPERRGGRGGLLLAVLALLVMGGAAGVVYVFVIKKDRGQQAARNVAVADAAVVAVAPDAAVVVTPLIDAPVAPVLSPLDVARGELGADLELKLRDALKALEGTQDPGVEAVRAHLSASIAQALTDRASVTADKAEADKMRKDAKTIVLEAATSAQRAFKATPNDAAANLAMAGVLRLQNKPARDIKRYLDAARANATPDWKRDIAIADALVLARDSKLDDAKAAFAAIDQGEDKLETSGDVRARFQLARIAYAQNKPTEAKPLVDQVLAAQPEHAASKALAARIETTVAKTDPLPPEDPPKNPGTGTAKPIPPEATGGDSYDRLLAKANTLAESNCSRAMEMYAKALEQKPNGVEALTGMGYCHIDAKQFASAFSKFRAALAVSSRYEPALWGVGEAYQQQGRKDQAIEAFKAYLETYPGSAKAQKALDRLGAGAAAPPDPNAGSGGTTPDPTPTPPPPAPTPPSEGAGSGSG
ncbi:MAG: tetratricopeptide repeat protein [Deltaproteobacteria bacterium]|nr:tetratricopeptide repeat protein [Deltaproteobacteria bacterium]